MKKSILLLLLLAGPTLFAAGTLPTFDLVGRDGRPFNSSALPTQGKWLIVYVAEGCSACDAVLGLFGESEPPNASARVVVIVEGRPGSAAAMSQRFPALALAGWYGDPSGGAARALDVPLQPTVVGVTDRSVSWSLPFATTAEGAKADLQPMLVRWLQ